MLNHYRTPDGRAVEMEGGTPPDGYEPLTLEEYEELTTVNEAAALERFFERIANRGKRK